MVTKETLKPIFIVLAETSNREVSTSDSKSLEVLTASITTEITATYHLLTSSSCYTC